MHSSPGSPDRQTRLRNVLAASIVVVASSTTLIWQQPTGVVLCEVEGAVPLHGGDNP